MMLHSCDGCGAVFSVYHAHREAWLHSDIMDLAALAYKEVLCKPVVCCGDASTPALIGDLRV